MPAPIAYPEHTVPHTALEDIQGLAIGLLTAAVGLTFLTYLGFITGQTAGLALIISYATGWSFGLVFTLVNLPFYAFAWKRMGAEFTLKSIGCVVALSVLVEWMPSAMRFEYLDPILGTAIFGVLTGFGLLGVFRHKGSLGGLGVIALIIQDRTGFRAGYVQLIVDAGLFAVAFFLFDSRTVLYSLFGAVILNGVIAFNHRRDRYIAN
ncbi:YitT family protein [Pseudooceanicola sp. LIPI14-2-Ac024]|uniref:YitT family protein n=1 Tax=Pseudooceanicola sp. LIPI14-2-Ac024 TaxID=3344875 RepID=UPI0035CF9249